MRGARGSSRLVSIVAIMAVVAVGSPPASAEAGEGTTPADSETDALREHATQLAEEGRTDEAILLAEQWLDHQEKALGPDHLAVASALGELALLYRQAGAYERAVPLAERALAIRQTILGPEHPLVATALNNVAALRWAKANYREAERLFLRALAIREKALGAGSPEVAEVANNLAVLYADMGDDERAERFAVRALGIWTKRPDARQGDYAAALSGLAALYEDRAEYARATPLAERALALWEEELGPDHPDVAGCLNNLAGLYAHQGDTARAMRLSERALAIWERALGPEHPNVASALNNLASFHAEQGEDEQARRLGERALAIWEHALGPDHPYVAGALDNLVLLDLARRDFSGALRLAERSASIRDRHALRTLVAGSEEQRRAYMATLEEATDATVSLHIRFMPEHEAAANLALTTLLRRKGRVLDAMASSFTVLRSHVTRRDQALLDRLSWVQSRLAGHASRAPRHALSEEDREEVARLEDERQRLESDIGERSAEFRAEQRLLTLDEVRAAIPEGAALVEIAVVRPFRARERAGDSGGPWARPRYVAYVLRRQGAVAWVDLGEAAIIDAGVEELRAALTDPRSHPEPLARALDALVMQPVRRLLGETRWVFVSSDGALALVPFGALVDEEGRYLVDRMSFTYLTSGRDLVRLGASAPPREGAVVIADPAFGSLQQAPGDGDGRRGLRSIEMADVRFPPLPGTAEEGRVVGRALGGARVLTGAGASEAALKALRGPRILHIATHGFFLPDERSGHAAARRENRLLRSGLALAGANARADGDEDGVMTALEASSLDLHGTKLVVLSACETGLGEVSRGEGVYGLRRALVMAGAETVVMSLWGVDDEATRELMVAYYQELEMGGGRSEAMRAAQRALLARKETSHPYYWAGFIVSGNGGTLDGRSVAPVFAEVRPQGRPDGAGECRLADAGRGFAIMLLVALGTGTAMVHRRGA